MKTINKSERGLIAAFFISDIVSFLLVIYNFLYAVPGERDTIPIFLMIMPAVYYETKKKIEMEQNESFQYKKTLWVLMSCLIITESMNLISIVL